MGALLRVSAVFIGLSMRLLLLGRFDDRLLIAPPDGARGSAQLWGLLTSALRGCALLIAAALQRVIGGILLRSIARAILTEGWRSLRTRDSFSAIGS